MIKIKPFENKYLDAAITLLERSDSTNRSIETWKGNDMTAMLAFKSNELIGIIPFERRSFCVGSGKFFDVLWVSGAHVEPDYRSQGIASAMDQKVKECFYPERKAILVCRGEETSAAYRWYKKSGYYKLLPILSFKKEVQKPAKKVDYALWENKHDLQLQERKVYDCFIRNIGSYGGFIKRHQTFWSDKLEFHYYKESYKYAVLALKKQDAISAYALIGKTSMKDGVPRIDILEFIVPDNAYIKESYFAAIMDIAYQWRVQEIRVQLSSQDHHLPWIKSLGFTNRWRSNIMGRLIEPIDYFKDLLSETNSVYQDYRFIVQTPRLGETCFGNGKNVVKIFMHESLFNQVMLNRCNVSNAIEEGRIVICEGDKAGVEAFGKIFPFYKWRYFHLDYI